MEAMDMVYAFVMRHWEIYGKAPKAIYVSEPLYKRLEAEAKVAVQFDLYKGAKAKATFCGVPVHRYESDAMEFSVVGEVHKIV